jgi:hypothetical protein
MSDPCTVIIGAPQLLDALREHAGGEGEVLTFSDRDALAALDAITSRRPRVVALERLFAITSRGAALINRIKADPALASAEIRVIAHDGSYSRVSRRRPDTAPPTRTAEKTGAPPPAADPPPRLDYRGTRRAARYRMGEGTEAQIDGASAQVIDLSVMGAQIVSAAALRPQQRVRITLADHAGVMRFNGEITWASFEIPNSTPRYRAGVEFTDAQAGAIEAFCKRHQLGTPE